MSGLPGIEGVTDLVEIGRGGFGVVYLGSETEFDRQVAVKVLLPSLDERTRRRFERERRAMGSVSGHPNIVTVYRGGMTSAEQPYLVMEYVRGGALSEQLQRTGPLDWRTAATIGAKLADALAVAHRAGILHRDVKPGNVFMTASGEPKLGDFGIARLDDGHDSRTGSITASIAHAPPEIVDGQRGDERSDLYSLASTIYAMTMGHAPFSRDPDQGVAALLGRIANDEPPGLHLETAAAGFEQSLRKAMSKRPDDRHDTVAAFGAELRRAASSPAPAPAPVSLVDHTTVAQPVAPTAAPIATTGGPVRAKSSGQIAVMALLALAIAGFGGWAVARAVVGNDTTEPVQNTPVATTTPADPTPIDEPTPAPTTEQNTRPTAAPTEVPTAVPTPNPTVPAASGGGSRGSGDLGGARAGFTRVQDFSGAFSVDVPQEWGFTVQDGSTVPLEDSGLEAVRVLSAGGTLEELSADIADRDLTRSGIYIFAARVGDGADANGALDVGLGFWSTCTQGDRAEILLRDGTAQYQILECGRPNGDATGAVVLGLVPDADPTVAVSIFLQFADIEDLASLPIILDTLRIDPSQVP